ncbi:hypothetical protein PPERSA_07495 [Pseudocohnilembus persalinus]|uniref:Sperm-tail PG-rich repeat n=1 Tax=Pseudocohnilembus persalinus TaxID=266149 RepID=A0A0V0R2I2_PSEPJ|nr:hypothetical protein PPERSA_07495 [Pseudocohnilembus persalinus]|eukprot:KRX08683.1 hypothetical protein PPERSA_07495 [Pseudocohnilembus persalinus]
MYGFYNVPDFKSKRGTSLGKGSKYDFTKGDKTKPSPNQYQSYSFIDYNKSKNKGPSFNSRDKLKFGDFKNKSGTAYQTPGVGSYNIKSPSGAPKFSLGSRTSDPQMLTTVRYNPGPGSHQLESINKSGSYFYRNFKSSGAPRFNPASSTRFKDKNSFVPGPGQYYTNYSNIVQQKESKYKSAIGGRWSQGARSTMEKMTKSPPPGFYKIVSEFGNTDYPPINRVKSQSHLKSSMSNGFQSKHQRSLQQTKSSFNIKTQPSLQKSNIQQKKEQNQEVLYTEQNNTKPLKLDEKNSKNSNDLEENQEEKSQ